MSERKMSNHPTSEKLLNIVYNNSDVIGHPEWETLEPAFDALLRTALSQSWQDGHDTALLNGQTKNPYEQDNQ